MQNETGGWRGSGDQFRMAPGATIVSRDGDSYEMRVDMPLDNDGFLGRRCPSCKQIFRIKGDDYKALPGELELWWVYCGHHDDRDKFVTQQQIDRAKRAFGDLGVQIIGQAIDQIFSSFRSPQRPARRSGLSIEISHRSKPFYPKPLPGINEEKLVRTRICARCSLRYAVFGEHRFCPVCGQLPAMAVALDALSAETARLDSLAQLPVPTAASLREQGVFTRQWADTLENLVGLVEALGSAVFRGAVPNADQQLKGKGNIFQRLDYTAELFTDAGYPDIRTVIEPARWQRLTEFWAIRHTYTHNDGQVDAKYLAKIPASTARIGQRLTFTEELCRQAITDALALCHALAGLTTA